jgi:hypothetical protein
MEIRLLKEKGQRSMKGQDASQLICSGNRPVPAGWRRWTRVKNEMKGAEAITRQGTTVHTRKRKRN